MWHFFYHRPTGRVPHCITTVIPKTAVFEFSTFKKKTIQVKKMGSRKAANVILFDLDLSQFFEEFNFYLYSYVKEGQISGVLVVSLGSKADLSSSL